MTTFFLVVIALGVGYYLGYKQRTKKASQPGGEAGGQGDITSPSDPDSLKND